MKFVPKYEPVPGTLRLTPYIGRNGIFDLLNEKGKIGEGVEIGTHRAEFSVEILSTWRGRKLHCVDPYTTEYDDNDPVSIQPDRDDDEREAARVLGSYRGRVARHRCSSLEAFDRLGSTMIVPEGGFDFVYIDGNHTLDHVRFDVAAWWALVGDGGLLAGHDYLCPGEINGGHGTVIQPIVNGFARRMSREVWLVPEVQSVPWSWYIVK